MQHEKLYNLQRTVYSKRKKEFLIRVERTISSQCRILVAQNFAFFLQQKEQNENKLYFVECRAFHTASCGMFRFFIENILVDTETK